MSNQDPEWTQAELDELDRLHETWYEEDRPDLTLDRYERNEDRLGFDDRIATPGPND